MRVCCEHFVTHIFMGVVWQSHTYFSVVARFAPKVIAYTLHNDSHHIMTVVSSVHNNMSSVVSDPTAGQLSSQHLETGHRLLGQQHSNEFRTKLEHLMLSVIKEKKRKSTSEDNRNHIKLHTSASHATLCDYHSHFVCEPHRNMWRQEIER